MALAWRTVGYWRQVPARRTKEGHMYATMMVRTTLAAVCSGLVLVAVPTAGYADMISLP